MVAGTKESSSVTQLSRKLFMVWMWLWGGNVQGGEWESKEVGFGHTWHW